MIPRNLEHFAFDLNRKMLPLAFGSTAPFDKMSL